MRLCDADFDVVLLERDAIAAHASGFNAGNLNPLIGTPPESIPFALSAFRRHLHLGLAQPLERVLAGKDESDRAELELVASLYNANQGFSARWLDAAELYAIEPRLAPGFRFALRTTGALSIDSRGFTHALAASAEMRGAVIMDLEVTGIVTAGARVTALRAGRQSVACDELVLATGPWVEGPGAWLGVEIPVTPVKGELLRVRLPGPPLACDFTWKSASLFRRGSGEIWIGTTTNHSGFDRTPTQAAKDELLRGAAGILPGIERSELLDHGAALRPMATPNAPIARRVDGWENIYIANGGGSKGVLFSLEIASRICDLIEDRNSGHPRHPPFRSH
jgi:glycine oxidase